jgi:hypothetical protein
MARKAKWRSDLRRVVKKAVDLGVSRLEMSWAYSWHYAPDIRVENTKEMFCADVKTSAEVRFKESDLMEYIDMGLRRVEVETSREGGGGEQGYLQGEGPLVYYPGVTLPTKVAAWGVRQLRDDGGFLVAKKGAYRVAWDETKFSAIAIGDGFRTYAAAEKRVREMDKKARKTWNWEEEDFLAAPDDVAALGMVQALDDHVLFDVVAIGSDGRFVKGDFEG